MLCFECRYESDNFHCQICIFRCFSVVYVDFFLIKRKIGRNVLVALS